jgi:hypothetical protein
MRYLFDEIAQEGEPAIEKLVETRAQENVELEFKTKANPTNGELTKDDRKNLGIALSALSNSMGGLLIWGIEASKNVDGIDSATAAKPIPQIEKFKNEVERAISQAIMPRHEGVRVLMVPRTTDPTSGYLAIHVERSERRPHRCEFGEKQYFKRIGDSSVAMEHYDIEDAFKRFSSPTLEVTYDLSVGPTRRDFRAVNVNLHLSNASNISARYPYLSVQSPDAGVTLGPSRSHRQEFMPPGYFEGGADDVVHPGLSVFCLYLTREFRIREPIYLPRGTLHPAMKINFSCGCLHSQPTHGTIDIAEEEIATALNLQIV